MAEQINDGDIFRWRYKDETPEQCRTWGRYHCKSQIAIARDGVLADTFWHGSPSTFWTYADALRDLDLVRLGNLTQLEKRPEYEVMYYDDADCVNLNHSNSSRDNFYVRKGAPRSRAKMRSTLNDRIADLTREQAHAEHKLDRAREQLAAIDRGDDIEKVYL